MIDLTAYDRRPIVVAIAGPNGAGKTTFYYSHLANSGLRFINADAITADVEIDAYAAARLADALRRALIVQRESFVFETVFSDPVQDKIAFLEETIAVGYTVVLCYIGLASPDQSAERVAMRVSQGGHDVPDDKIQSRFLRTLRNLREAISRLPHVLVYDNCDLLVPYRLVAEFQSGELRGVQEPIPEWLRPMISKPV